MALENREKQIFTTNKKNTHCKRLACHVVLEYGLKIYHSTDKIDVHYKCIRNLLRMSVEPLQWYACLINVHEIATSRTDIKTCLLNIWLQNNIKRKFLPVNIFTMHSDSHSDSPHYTFQV